MHRNKGQFCCLFMTLLLSGCMLSLPAFSQDSDALPDGFVYIDDMIPDVIIEMRYASSHNFTGKSVPGYEANRAILTKEAAEKLAEAAAEARDMGYRMKIFDAYRPLDAVKAFVKWAQDPYDLSGKEEFYPDIKNKQKLLDLEYISRSSNHCKGSAVDLTLTDMNGNELDMGTGFDFFGDKAGHGANGLTKEQQKNREILSSLMEKHGFRRFQREWWHYRLQNQPYPDQNFNFPVR